MKFYNNKFLKEIKTSIIFWICNLHTGFDIKEAEKLWDEYIKEETEQEGLLTDLVEIHFIEISKFNKLKELIW